MKTNIKVIATSLSLATSVGAVAGMGGLSVQSHLGQPFSGSIVVSGDEARALIASGSVSVSGGIRGSVIKQGEDRVLVRLRSTSPVREPVITFTVSAGRQTREYTAFIDPVRYTPKEAPIHQESHSVRAEEPTRPSQQRTQQRDFIERKKPVVEQRRAASSVPLDTSSSEMTSVKKSAKVAVSPRRHRAHAGENLANIVERYRPRNMSQQTAMRALMLANPSAFKHGTTIRRNVTLYIPTESQWHAYAQRAQKQTVKERVKQVRQARHEPTNVIPVESDVVEPRNNKPEPVQPPVVEESKPVQTPPKPVQPAQVASEVKKAPSETKASETVKATEPEKKNQPASNVAAQDGSQVAKPAEPKADVASKVEPKNASAASNTALAASQASVSQPPAPQPRPEPVPAPVAEEPVEEETDYLTLGLMGLGGAAVLGAAGFGANALLRRRKKTTVVDDSEWETEEVGGKGASIDDDEWGGDMDFGPAATSPKKSAASSIDDEPYFGDDEFRLDKDEFSLDKKSSPVNQAAPKDEFSLDNFDSFNDFNDFNDFSSPAASGNAKAAPQDDDWSLPDNDPPAQNTVSGSSDFVVADEDDWSLDKLDAISEAGKQHKPEQTFSLDDFVVDDFEPAKPVAKAEPAVVETVTAEPVFDDSGVFDLSDFEPEPAAPVASAPKNQDDDAFSLDSFDDFVAPKAETKASVAAVEEPVFDLDDFVVESQPETVAPAAPVSDLNLDDFVQPAAKPVEEDLSFGLDAFEDFVLPETDKAEPSVASTPASTSAVEEDLSFGLDAFEDFVAPEVANVPEVKANQDLGDLNDFATFEELTAVPTTSESPIQAAAPESLATFDDALNLDDFVVAEPIAPAAPIEPETSFDDLLDLGVGETVTSVSQVVESNVDLGLGAFTDFTDTPAVAPSLDLGSLETFTESAPVVPSLDLDALETFTEVAPVAPSLDLDALETFTEAAPVAPALDLGALETFTESPTPIAPAAEVAFDDLASLDTFVVEESAVPSVAAEPAPAAIQDDLAFGLDAFDDFTAPVASEIAPVATTEQPLNDLGLDDFNLMDTVDNVIATPAIEETPISFDAPVVEEPLISLDVPVVSASLDDLALDVDFDSVIPAAVSQPVGMMDLATGPLAQVSSLDSVNLDALEVIEDVQDWQQAGQSNVGFVSGSVNDMTEPLEAKFELAKMYLEIDDAVAARETLRELISESSGEIQEQAKNLLADLGN